LTCLQTGSAEPTWFTRLKRGRLDIFAIKGGTGRVLLQVIRRAGSTLREKRNDKAKPWKKGGILEKGGGRKTLGRGFIFQKKATSVHCLGGDNIKERGMKFGRKQVQFLSEGRGSLINQEG